MIFPGVYSADSAENKTFRPRRSSSRSRPKSSGIATSHPGIATNHSRLVPSHPASPQVTPSLVPSHPASPQVIPASSQVIRHRQKSSRPPSRDLPSHSPHCNPVHTAPVIARFRKKPWQSSAHSTREGLLRPAHAVLATAGRDSLHPHRQEDRKPGGKSVSGGGSPQSGSPQGAPCAPSRSRARPLPAPVGRRAAPRDSRTPGITPRSWKSQHRTKKTPRKTKTPFHSNSRNKDWKPCRRYPRSMSRGYRPSPGKWSSSCKGSSLHSGNNRRKENPPQRRRRAAWNSALP